MNPRHEFGDDATVVIGSKMGPKGTWKLCWIMTIKDNGTTFSSTKRVNLTTSANTRVSDQVATAPLTREYESDLSLMESGPSYWDYYRNNHVVLKCDNLKQNTYFDKIQNRKYEAPIEMEEDHRRQVSYPARHSSSISLSHQSTSRTNNKN